MATSLLQYWLETSLGLVLFWTWYLFFLRRRLGVALRKSYLILTPFLALGIPLTGWTYARPAPVVGLSELADRWWGWVALHFGDMVQVSGVTLLSIVYFLVTSVLLLRLADRLVLTWQKVGAGSPLSFSGASFSGMQGLTSFFSAAYWGLSLPANASLKELMVLRLRLWHTLEVVVLEGGLALFWFQPLLFLFRNEVRAVSADSPAGQTAKGGTGMALLPVAGLATLLVWLFAANQVCRWPQWYWLESRTHALQAQLEEPLVRIGKPGEEVMMWGWGGYWSSMVRLHEDSIVRFPVRVLSPFEFYSIFQQDWTWQKGRWKEEFASLEALALFPYQVEPIRMDSWGEVRTFISAQRFATEMTLLVKLRDLDGQEWLGVVGVSEKGRLYGFNNVLQTWDPGMPFLNWRKGKNERPLAELLPHSPYLMTWGDLRLPLDLRANPNVYHGYMALDLEEFERLIDQPIRFYHNDSLLLPEAVWINESDAHVVSNRYSFPVRRTRRDSTETYLETDGLQLRPAVTWTINARLPGEVEVNAINLYIRDTDSHYDPSLWVPGLPRVDSLFSFQLITRDEPPSVVRMDTTLARNRKIMDMYRSNPTYRIVHIPGFETFDRLVQLPGEIMQLIRVEGLPRDSIFSGDAYPELPYDDLQNAYMEWGGSFAAPNSKVYALEDFLTQSRLKPKIRIPGRHVDIQSFVLYVFREDKPLHAEWFSPGRLAGWDADSLAYWIRPKTSMFIDQLVVADTSGRLLSVPLAFAFHIGKSERDIRWKVVLEEVAEREFGEKERLEEEQALRFRNYRLSELIPQLIPYPGNRMEFRGLDHDPVIRMELVADGPLPDRAREFMLYELQKRYRFEISHERLARPNWRLHLKDADLLNRSAYEGAEVPGEQIRVFNWDGTHVLTGVTLQELAYHLEERFDEIMEWFPNAYIDDRFIFSLDCSSLNAVQSQLEAEYGIVFQRMDTLWQGLVVRFY